MPDNEEQQFDACINRFIELANTMHGEKIPQGVVSSALMTASGIYATFVVSGNDGGLTESGIDKVTDAYRGQLEQVQKMRKKQQERRANEASSST